MPLVTICGKPCCGKSAFSNVLMNYLQDQGWKSVRIVSEETQNIKKGEGYRDSLNEKKTRGALKSAVDHLLDPETVVIVDSMNYIKGYRYELFCIARSLRTSSCCVLVECEDTVSDAWSEARTEKGEANYDPRMIVDLRRRFELPNEKNRWDSPLFRVNMTPAAAASTTSSTEATDTDITVDTVSIEVQTSAAPTSISAVKEAAAEEVVGKTVFSSWRPKSTAAAAGTARTSATATAAQHSGDTTTGSEGKLWFSGAHRNDEDALKGYTAARVVELIHQHLKSIPTAAPNSSTISVPKVEADLLYELDRVSQRIVQSIVTHQTESLEGTPLVFHEFDRSLALHRHVGLAELQRHRRQFVKANSHTPPSDVTVVGSSFIDFLAVHL